MAEIHSTTPSRSERQKKSPAFQFYPSDWLSSTSVSLMSPAEEGAYIRLLCHAWASEDCGLPDDDEVLAELSRLRGKWKQSAAKIRKCFESVGGRLFNPRLAEEYQKQLEWRRKSAEGGKLAQGKKKRNQPPLNHPSTTLEPPLQNGCGLVGENEQLNANSSSSSSSSSSTTLPINGFPANSDQFNQDLQAAWDWFRQEFPGEINPDWDAQIFASVIQTFDDIRLLRLNLPKWKATRKWLDGYVPTAENFVKKRQFRYPPKDETKADAPRPLRIYIPPTAPVEEAV